MRFDLSWRQMFVDVFISVRANAYKMRSPGLAPITALALVVAASACPQLAAQSSAVVAGDTARVTIRAGTLLDGRGGSRRDVALTVRGGRIVALTAASPGDSVVDYDLRRLTVLPGLVDAHVHLGWYITSRGVLHRPGDGDTREQAMLAAAANAYATLAAGVTPAQSVGGPEDLPLREAIAARGLPGPRLLTSIIQINHPGLRPDSLRTLVRAIKAAGADAVKLFASAGVGGGGDQTMSDEQLAAACGEAKAQGIRTVVHAISPRSIRAVILAGCTQIEHGTFATDAELRLMAERGTIFDPQVCLVFQNYLDNRDVFERSGFTERSFAAADIFSGPPHASLNLSPRQSDERDVR